MKKYDYLIVGAGLFGLVFSHMATKEGKNASLLINESILVAIFIVKM